jgi:hypothetical protein
MRLSAPFESNSIFIQIRTAPLFKPAIRNQLSETKASIKPKRALGNVADSLYARSGATLIAFPI